MLCMKEQFLPIKIILLTLSLGEAKSTVTLTYCFKYIYNLRVTDTPLLRHRLVILVK